MSPRTDSSPPRGSRPGSGHPTGKAIVLLVVVTLVLVLLAALSTF